MSRAKEYRIDLVEQIKPILQKVELETVIYYHSSFGLIGTKEINPMYF